MANSVRTVHVRIEGRVQGVGYRAWTHRAALEAGLTGWVRNRPDGSVEAVFQGAHADVARMIEDCRSGPDGSVVSCVEVLGEGVGAFRAFEVRATG